MFSPQFSPQFFPQLSAHFSRASRYLLLCAVAALTGCASTYQLTLMPRTAGKLYYGEAVEESPGGPARVNITIDNTTYSGTWIATTPESNNGTIAAGFGFGSRHGGIGFGTPVIVDSSNGGESKALLQADNGAGLRCDFKGTSSGRSGGGTCTDDKGLVYDVQIAAKR